MRNTSQAPLHHLCNNHNYYKNMSGVDTKALEQGKTFKNNNVSKTYLDLNDNLDSHVYNNILHIVKQFSTHKIKASIETILKQM